jgi:hypothetical protein
LRGQRIAQKPHHRGLATEQMDTAGDIQKQAVRGIQRHQRREAVAPFGNGVERLGIRGFIGVEYFQARADGAGIGERQAYFKAETGGRVVHGKNLQRVVLPGYDDAGIVFMRVASRFARIRFSRRGVVAGELALDAVDGQARQPQAEDTPPVFQRDTHHISIP